VSIDPIPTPGNWNFGLDEDAIKEYNELKAGSTLPCPCGAEDYNSCYPSTNSWGHRCTKKNKKLLEEFIERHSRPGNERTRYLR
jgi:hypothetical protein